MARTESTMLNLGTTAPAFTLPNLNPNVLGASVSLADFTDTQGVLVMFVCNHCPYVIHLREALVAFAEEYQAKGIQLVAISSNNAESHPQDGPEAMSQEALTYHFPYPYLYDETQEVAQAYQAACTPDFYLFDGAHKLVYRGQFDASRPKNDAPIDGADMRAAADALLAKTTIAEQQTPSMGCNIKWAAGNEPNYST